jgi:hypothetical protein
LAQDEKERICSESLILKPKLDAWYLGQVVEESFSTASRQIE